MIGVGFTVQNDGVGVAGDSEGTVLWNDHVYLSSNVTLSGGYFDLGIIPRIGTLAPGNAYTTNATVTLPAVPRGEYYIIVKADADDVLLETNELNNTNSRTLRIVDPVLDMPVAEAGSNRDCFVGQSVSLDGSASSNAQNYGWSFVSWPVGSVSQLIDGDTATPQFMPDVPGQYIMQLGVDYYGLTSTPKTVTVTASWVNWYIDSPYGQPTPGTGVWHLAYGTAFTNSVISTQQMGDTQYVCSGWTLTGHEPATGTNNQFAVIVTNDAMLAWLWTTNYWLQAQINGSGTLSHASGYYPSISTQHVSSIPAYGWLLTGWSGDVIAGHNVSNVDLQMNQPWHIIASFSDDPDGDGLKNVDEWSHGTDPWNPSTSGDGFGDGWEVQHGWDPLVSHTDVVSYVLSKPGVFGVYTTNAIQNMNLGGLTIAVSNNMVMLRLQMKESSNLVDWVDMGTNVIWSSPVVGDKKFYYLRTAPIP